MAPATAGSRVKDALAEMQAAIRGGNLAEARSIGSRAPVPLSISASDVQLGERLHEGPESAVYRGTFDGLPVAVKKVKIGTSHDLERFRRELLILATLLGHPNVIQLTAAKALPPDYLILTPLQHANLRQLVYDRGWRPSWTDVLRIARQLAAALQHAHAAGVVHRDIKLANLLSADASASTVYLSDLGIADWAADVAADAHDADSLKAHGKPTGGFHKKHMVGTLEYMAPEVLLKAPHSFASDVYAFGVAVNELATRTYPFSDCTKDNPEVHTVLEMGYGRNELAAAVAAEGLRPLLPSSPSSSACPPRRKGGDDSGGCSGCPTAYKALMSACWHSDPAQRPSWPQVLALLDQIQVEVDSHPVWSLSSSKQQQQQQSAAAGCFQIAALSGSAAVAASAAGGDGKMLPGNDSITVVAEPMDVDGTGDDNAAVAADCPSCERAASGGKWGRGIEAQEPEAPMAAGVVPQVHAGGFEAIGPREAMEDRSVLLLQAWGQPHVHMVAVFDGHRGADAAAYAAAHVTDVLERCIREAAGGATASNPAVPQSSSSSGGSWPATLAPTEGAPPPAWLRAALGRSFCELDAGYRRQWELWRAQQVAKGRPADRYPGCTALTALVWGGSLFVANAGDSRAVLCRGGHALPLSRDHTTALDDERSRILASGGKLTQQAGSWRIGAAGLQVTRSLGDFDVKGALSGGGVGVGGGGGCGVTAEPEVSVTALRDDDLFLVLATDGLWDVITSEEAVGLVRDTVKDPVMCSKRLVTEALARGSLDNVTAAVIFLRPVSTLERIFSDGRESHEVTRTHHGTRGAARANAPPPRQPTADEMRDTY